MTPSAIPDSQPLAMMTAGDLRALIAEEWSRHQAEAAKTKETAQPEPYIFGKKAIAEALHISVSTFDRWHNAGKLDGLICKIGNQLRANRDRLNQGIEKKFIQ